MAQLSGSKRGQSLSRAARAALWSGSIASITSAAMLSVRGIRDENSAAGPLNGPSQWLWGEAEAYTRKATLRHTAVGYAIHHFTSVGWATLHELMFVARRSTTLRHLGHAAVTATLAYVVDYHVTPRRFRPGFKKHLPPSSIFLSYAAFAAGLAIATTSSRRLAG